MRGLWIGPRKTCGNRVDRLRIRCAGAAERLWKTGAGPVEIAWKTAVPTVHTRWKSRGNRVHDFVLGVQIVAGLSAAATVRGQAPADIEWPAYANDAGGSHYSKADQIGRASCRERV